MHEYSIVHSLLETILDECKKKNITEKINTVNIVIGKLNWIYPEILKESFEIQSNGTGVEGAELKIIERPAIIKCRDCLKTTELTEPVFLCQHCSSAEVEIISGQELYLDSFEISEF